MSVSVYAHYCKCYAIGEYAHNRPMSTGPGVGGLCTKNPVSTLTRRSMRPKRSYCEGLFATKESCFYSKKSY